jgi:hypothetical protein
MGKLKNKTTNMENEKSKKPWYKIWWVWVIAFFVLGGIVNAVDPQAKNSPVPTQAEQTATTTPSQPKTDQQLLEDQVTAAISNVSGISTKLSYKEVDVEKSDSDRPQGTTMVTAKIDASDFFDKDSLMRDTSKVSAQVIRAIYGSNINAYDVFVWYYGQTKDRYGNTKDDVILSYAIDKPTFQKINWTNFDAGTFCDFLQQEEQMTTDASANDACHALVNIQ